MHLTTRGWSFAGTILGLYAAGRALGTVELAMLAAAGLVTMVLAVVLVFLGQPDVLARRILRPARLHAGGTAYAEIELRNRGRRRTGVLSVTDRFSGRREARFAVAPLRPGESARGAYRVPTGRRGVFAIGPLRVGVTDPLGLVRRVLQSDAAESVTVYPRIEFVAALPQTVGRDLVGGAVNDFSRARAGMEFHSLREYQVGDDLRRVHWRSTARTGQLMIREHDVPWQTRATLLLDDRPSKHTPGGFERAVEAVASVATALHQRKAIVRLVTTSGLDSGFGSGHEHYEAIMERLAVAEATTTKRFEDLAARLHRQSVTGALIAFTGTPSPGSKTGTPSPGSKTGTPSPGSHTGTPSAGPDAGSAGSSVESSVLSADPDLMKLGTLARRFGFVAVVYFRRNDLSGGNAAGGVTVLPGLTLVDVAPRASFATAWNEAMVLRFGTRGAPQGKGRG